MGTYQWGQWEPAQADHFVPVSNGNCERIRNHSVGWHTRYLTVVRLLKTTRLTKVEKRSIYTKVPTEINFKGSRDQQKVIICLDPLHNRPGNFVVFFLH